MHKVTASKPKAGLIYIFLDEELYKTVITQGWCRRLHLPKHFDSLKQVDAWFYQLEYLCAREYVYNLLSKRHYPSPMLKQKLSLRKVSKETVQKILSECEDNRYIDNQLWVESFIKREFSKGWGPKAILLKLREKGFSQEKSSKILSVLISKEDEALKITERLSQRKFTTVQKAYGYFFRKGFDSEIIQSVLANS